MAKDRAPGVGQDDKTLPPQATGGEQPNGKKQKKAPRTAPPDLRAMNRIDAILSEFEPEAADRILRYCKEKAFERLTAKNLGIAREMRERALPAVIADPRRQPGGDLWTPPLPGFIDTVETTNRRGG